MYTRAHTWIPYRNEHGKDESIVQSKDAVTTDWTVYAFHSPVCIHWWRPIGDDLSHHQLTGTENTQGCWMACWGFAGIIMKITMKWIIHGHSRKFPTWNAPATINDPNKSKCCNLRTRLHRSDGPLGPSVLNQNAAVTTPSWGELPPTREGCSTKWSVWTAKPLGYII